MTLFSKAKKVNKMIPATTATTRCNFFCTCSHALLH